MESGKSSGRRAKEAVLNKADPAPSTSLNTTQNSMNSSPEGNKYTKLQTKTIRREEMDKYNTGSSRTGYNIRRYGKQWL